MATEQEGTDRVAIHPTAIISPQADLDPTVEVGPYCIVDAHVTVGPNCRLLHHVYLTGWTTIDECCTLHPGVVVGHEPQDLKYKGERSFCRIGARNIFRENVTIHRGTTPESATTVGDDCFLLVGSHVGHNCTLGHRVTMVNNALLAGHVEVGDRVTLGGGACVHQFVRIGRLAMIGGMARVPMDIMPFAMVDARGKVAGINSVGMKRAEIPREDIHEIRRAYRLLFSHAARFREGIDRLRAELATPAGRHLVEFLSAESRRGHAGPSRQRIGPESPAED